MSSFSSTDRIPFVTLERPQPRQAEPLRVRPFLRARELPRPKTTSGLFPAVPVRPGPPMGYALRARRAVALTVVIGSVCLLTYAAWQRVAHGATPPAAQHARARG